MTIESAGIMTLKTKGVIDSITRAVRATKIISIPSKSVRKDAVHSLPSQLSSLSSTLKVNTVSNHTTPAPVFKTKFGGSMIALMVSAKSFFTAVVTATKTNSSLEAIVRPSVGTLRTSANCKHSIT